MRMVTVPNASIAVWITAAPSVTEELLTTAFPPATLSLSQMGDPVTQSQLTFSNFVDNPLCSSFVEVVNDDVGAPRSIGQCVT